MARVREDFEGVVYVRVNGLVKALRANDDIPSGAPVGSHIAGVVPAEVSDATVPPVPPVPESPVAPEQPVEKPVDDPEYPGDDATREDLNTYAATIGLNPEEFKNKADLVAAIHEATEEV